MVYGIGVDLVENERIDKIIARWGEKFLARVFSEREIAYCGRHARRLCITERVLPLKKRF
jgi:holo-[acyl-carrier protein] synthase